jgi:hypothetical protein
LQCILEQRIVEHYGNHPQIPRPSLALKCCPVLAPAPIIRNFFSALLSASLCGAF